jgi:hypothetical protein
MICLFINLFVCVNSYSQDSAVLAKPLQAHITTKPEHNKLAFLPLFSIHAKNASAPTSTFMNSLPVGYYYHSIGFFCQKELQLEKAIKVPVKIRLGNVHYTDRMEGKGQANSTPFK